MRDDADDALVFRPAHPGDADAIRGLVLRAYAKWVPVVGREPRPMTADYDRAVLEHDFDLAFAAGALAGLAETELRADHLWIENLAVAPEAQGRGLGRLLLARAETRALSAGRGEIRLLTNSAMLANIALYEHLGYVRTHVEPYAGGSIVHMARTLRGGQRA